MKSANQTDAIGTEDAMDVDSTQGPVPPRKGPVPPPQDPPELLILAPNLLRLEEHEKFRDTDDNVLEIETRGERNRNHIYFKVTDVMRAFDFPSLNNNLHKDHTQFQRGEHYQTFFVPRGEAEREERSRQEGYTVPLELMQNSAQPAEEAIPSMKARAAHTSKREDQLFLTYHGVVTVLYTQRRNKTAKHFQTWAEERLFTLQMGTPEDRLSLAKDAMGVPTDAMKDALSTRRGVHFSNMMP
ncbi:hypothetical protein HDV00_009908 [Rhizophlyctis rosea]|nr:hypothetical protein HDV00_009908 [Rhizophlyctis rosea]